MGEPIAIVGIGALWDGARGAGQLWDLLTGTRPPAPDGHAVDPRVDLAAFRVPPVQAGTLPRLQLAAFDVAAQTLRDAGHPDRALPAATTDVLVATCGGLDRHHANAARVDAVRYADALARAAADRHGPRCAGVDADFADAALERLGAAPHDRVGEMTSSIPARVAAAYGLRGRAVALESADVSAVLALGQAVLALRDRSADAVLVLAGRVHSGDLLARAFAAKSPPGAPPLGEGVIGLLLKRAVDATRAGDRAYATVRDVTTRHAGRRGTFRRPASGTVSAAADDPVPPAGHVEAFGPGARLRPTLAADALAAVAAVGLGLHHERRPVPGAPAWPAGELTGRVAGTSLYGTAGHVVLDRAAPIAAGRAAAAPSVREAPEPIAVLAGAGRFAGARDLDGFWAASSEPDGQFARLPQRLLDRALFHRPGGMSLRHSYTDQGAPLPVPEAPPAGTPVMPARYAALDVAQRIALDVAADLFGRRVDRATLRGPGIVAVGSTLALTRDRELGGHLRLPELDDLARGLPALAALTPDERDELVKLVRDDLALPDLLESPHLLDGLLAGGVPALVANEFGLAATPVAVEAACASSLAALDVAAGALRSGTADFAVAGGVEIACTTRDLVLCSALGLLSATLISPFDVAADGFTPGDGCALFALKRLRDAERDGDPVAGVLRGVGAANDARSLIAPDVDGQELALRRAYAGLDVDPATVDYVEAHGTGTAVGDRVEIEALRRVYGGPSRRRPLNLGTAKGSFGHTFAAAGGAGLLRVLEALRRGSLPPTARVRTPQPELALHTVPARIPTRPEPWPAPPAGPRRAGVSSFGTGGIDYHLVVEEYR